MARVGAAARMAQNTDRTELIWMFVIKLYFRIVFGIECDKT